MIPETATTSSDASVAHVRYEQVLRAAALFASGWLLWHFHNRYWYPTDDGFYANIAERLLNGEALGRDVQDIHPGLIHFLHAGAMWLFGVDMVSLRYPLAAVGLLQSLFVYLLVRPHGPLLAAATSVASVALGAPQFFNPTPNWYCLSLTIVLAWWITQTPHDRRQLLGAGVLLGVITLLRQLSGVWVAMGLIVVVLGRVDDTGSGRRLVARGVLSIMLAGLVWYLMVSPDAKPGGLLFIAAWPAAILMWSLMTTRAADGKAAAALGHLALGAALPAVPLVVYHLAHNSLAIWFSDIVLSPIGETEMSFFGDGDWYGALPLVAAFQVVSSPTPAHIANGLYWMALPLASATNGVLLMRHIRRGGTAAVEVPIIAAFTAMVSLFYAGPLYLYYSVGLSIVAIVLLLAIEPRRSLVLASGAVFLTVVAIVFHAGQSRTRTPREILEGRRVSDVWSVKGRRTLPRATLLIEDADARVYESLLHVIHQEVPPGEAILALPNDAELYFLSERRSPVRFYNSVMIQTRHDQVTLESSIRKSTARLVFYRPADKYNTPLVQRLMTEVRQKAQMLTTIDGLEIYRVQ